MISQVEVISKLDSLKEYSALKNTTTGTLFDPVYAEVYSYFSTNQSLKAPLTDCIKYMYNDIWRRNTVYEHDYPLSLPTNYPVGYDDIEKCFYSFSELINITNELFYNAFVFSVPAGTVLSNSYLTSWTTEINAAKTGDVSNVSALAEWCKNSEGDSDIISLVEERGTIKSTLTMRQISEEIYINRHMKNVIEFKNAGTYIPSYYKE